MNPSRTSFPGQSPTPGAHSGTEAPHRSRSEGSADARRWWASRDVPRAGCPATDASWRAFHRARPARLADPGGARLIPVLHLPDDDDPHLMTRHLPARAATVAALLLAAACASVPRGGSAGDPRAAMEELLAADRAFAAASARTDLVSGISAMFAPDVVMPLPDGTFAESADAATAALRENPANAGARVEWAPVRGGISADGRHGFTFGYMTVRQADGTVNPAKYLAYWVRQPAGWRVAVYRRSRRAEGEVSTDPLPPALPARMVPPIADEAVIAAHRTSLDAAERAFSDESQEIGLGPAFAKWGSEDAMNMGRGATFILGASAIGAAIGGGSTEPSPVSWAPDRVIVASSGDLGVTIGRIRQNAPAADAQGPSSVPFFTVWRRPTPDAPWRYIAE